MDIAILLYQGVTALDAIGPYEVLVSMPDAHVQFVAKEPGVITTHAGVAGLHANMAFSDMPAPDIFLLPGCPDVSHVAGDKETIDWVQQAHTTSTWSTSVCTGALILGVAGILDGYSTLG